MRRPILFLYFIALATCVLRLADLSLSTSAILQYGDRIEQDSRVAKYEFDSVLGQPGPFGNVYLANLKGDADRPLIIKVANPSDVILSNEFEPYNPCWSYDEQKKIGSESAFVLEPIETIPIAFDIEKVYFCVIVMEKAISVLDQPLFDRKSEMEIAENTKALAKFILQIVRGVKDIHLSQFTHKDLKLSNMLLVEEQANDPVMHDDELLTTEEAKQIPYKAVINDFDVISNLKLHVKLENFDKIIELITANYEQLSKMLSALISFNKEFVDAKNIIKRVEAIIETNINEEKTFFREAINNQPKSRRQFLLRRPTFI